MYAEGYRKQAENNEYILEAHHEIRHHMNALSAYLKERDYMGAEEYIHKFADDGTASICYIYGEYAG